MISIHPKIVSVRESFDLHGVSVARWAKVKGFTITQTYQVLTEGKIPKRGERHRIAVALGIKPQPSGEFVDLDKELSEIAQLSGN